MKQSKIVIGITGDIGAGKSTVSNYLIKKGYTVIDADKIAREVSDDENIKAKIAKAFKGVIVEGVLDRKRLGEKVFNNSENLIKLNSIMHPEIEKRIIDYVNTSTDNYIFIDAALLYETGLDKICDFTLYIDMDLDMRTQRIVNRDNISKEFAIKKIEAFGDNGYKKKDSILVENNGTMLELYQKIDKIIAQLTK